ncbi:hypothetical protein DFH09DRAFT_397618 [Mycena vulgaris]|nr:hypothetical protein DFH09DRAFT_397618 [Mycena vulgaris]
MAYLPRHMVWSRLVSFCILNCQSVGFVRPARFFSSSPTSSPCSTSRATSSGPSTRDSRTSSAQVPKDQHPRTSLSVSSTLIIRDACSTTQPFPLHCRELFFLQN